MSISLNVSNYRGDAQAFFLNLPRCGQLARKIAIVSLNIIFSSCSFLYQKACELCRFLTTLSVFQRKKVSVLDYQYMPRGGEAFILKAIELYRQEVEEEKRSEFNTLLAQGDPGLFSILGCIAAKAFVLSSTFHSISVQERPIFFPAYFLAKNENDSELRDTALALLWASKMRVAQFSEEEKTALLHCFSDTPASSLAGRISSVQENILAYGNLLIQDADFIKCSKRFVLNSL